MSVIHIQGLGGLKGAIEIQGSKNAVLPVMAASLLHRGITVLRNVPKIQDVYSMMEILEYLGCELKLEGHSLTIDTGKASGMPIPVEMAGKMRSSIMLLGPMLGRFREAVTSLPGGCCLGKRPVNLHLEGLRKLGADIREEGAQIAASAAALEGSDVHLDYPSVGATENLIMAAAAARGVTALTGAAREPEIEVLCDFLKAAGARIEGAGTETIVIYGGSSLHDVEFAIPGDRIVAGTYLGAVMTAGGKVLLSGAPQEHMESNLKLASRMGAEISCSSEGILVEMNRRPIPVSFATGPYPAFSTDLQPVMMAAAAVAEGKSHIRETVFENRFSCAKELRKLGAHIIIEGRNAQIEGRFPLSGGRVYAADLRGGAALVTAALASWQPVTVDDRCGHIQRGYEDICRDLQGAGARIMETED